GRWSPAPCPAAPDRWRGPATREAWTPTTTCRPCPPPPLWSPALLTLGPELDEHHTRDLAPHKPRVSRRVSLRCLEPGAAIVGKQFQAYESPMPRARLMREQGRKWLIHLVLEAPCEIM